VHRIPLYGCRPVIAAIPQALELRPLSSCDRRRIGGEKTDHAEETCGEGLNMSRYAEVYADWKR
jgi:hypothetical protein